MHYSGFKEELDKVDVLEAIPLEEFIKKEGAASSFMKNRYEQIKINQLRNFFSEIKAIQRSEKTISAADKARLEMNLAYDYGRNVINKDFYELMITLLAKTRINNQKDFSNFVEMVQALIAYHKFYVVSS